MTPPTALRPYALPPVSSTACERSITVPGRSPSVPRVPGAPPRTSTPPTAPSGASTTVQPVRPIESVQWPTRKPFGSSRSALLRPESADPVVIAPSPPTVPDWPDAHLRRAEPGPEPRCGRPPRRAGMHEGPEGCMDPRGLRPDHTWTRLRRSTGLWAAALRLLLLGWRG